MDTVTVNSDCAHENLGVIIVGHSERDNLALPLQHCLNISDLCTCWSLQLWACAIAQRLAMFLTCLQRISPL